MTFVHVKRSSSALSRSSSWQKHQKLRSVSGRHTPFAVCLRHPVRAQNAWISGKGERCCLRRSVWLLTLINETARCPETLLTAPQPALSQLWEPTCGAGGDSLQSTALRLFTVTTRLVSGAEFQFIPRHGHVCRHCGWLSSGNWGIRVLIPVGADMFVFCSSCRTASGLLSILWNR